MSRPDPVEYRRARRIAGATMGGLVAGLALSAVMLLGERLSGQPSELIELERATAAKLDLGPAADSDGAAGMGVQAITHGGHLALSALAGATYAVATSGERDDARDGAAFGAAFFIAAYGVVGPALGVTPLPWRQPAVRAVQHPIVHILFGLAMARFARAATTSRS